MNERLVSSDNQQRLYSSNNQQRLYSSGNQKPLQSSGNYQFPPLPKQPEKPPVPQQQPGLVRRIANSWLRLTSPDPSKFSDHIEDQERLRRSRLLGVMLFLIP